MCAVSDDVQISVRKMDMRYRHETLLKDLNFDVHTQDVFVIMGESGCGKSTLLRHMIGLTRPRHGDIFYQGKSFWHCGPEQREEMMQHFGVMYQNGALWTSMTLVENVALPLKQFTTLTRRKIKHAVEFKLALVGLDGYGDYYPAELSGGMRKRAAIARAMALDPKILFFDEPSAGLDPINSKRLDELLLELRDNFGATIVVVTHELDSIFSIANNSIFIEPKVKSIIGRGNPKKLLETTDNPKIIEFLTRGERYE